MKGTYVVGGLQAAETVRRAKARRLRTALAVLVLPALLAAQTRPAATGTLTGRVMRDNTPVARALISIDAGDGRAERVTATNDNGQFVFSELPAGRYLVTATKTGWMATHYGSPRPGRPPGTRVAVEENARVNITIPMIPGGVIAGRVVDADGSPQAHVFPILLESRWVGDREVITRPNLPLDVGFFEKVTDDRGEFRLYGLPPGTYYLSVSPRILADGVRLTTSDEVRWATAAQIDLKSMPPLGPIASDATVFFPGTTDSAQAQPIVLGPGEVREGLVHRLIHVPVARVSGIASTIDGSTSCARVTIEDIDSRVLLGGSPSDALANQTGAFSITEIPPGEYRVTARTVPCASGAALGARPQPGQPARPVYWGQATIRVNGQDVDGVAITMSPASTMTGRLVFEGKTPPPANLETIRLQFLTPRSLAAGTVGVYAGPNALFLAEVAANGSFRIGGLQPDRYLAGASWPNMRAADGTTGWWLSSVRVGDRDFGVEPIDVPVSTNVNDVVVTFRDRIGSIEGTLTDAAGKPAPEYFVMAFPVNRAEWTLRRGVAPVRPGTDGRYKLVGLQPGDYYVVVVTSVTVADAVDPAFLELLLPSAVKVSVADGGTSRTDLKIAK